MDSLNILNLKVEKANAMLRYRRLRNLGTLLRFMELLVLLIMIFRFSVQLPFNPKLSGDHFRGLTVVLFSPGFVFVVGNAIIITLFLKPGCLSHREGTVNKSGDDFCAEYVENSVVGTAAAMVDTHNYAERKIHRSRSENLSRVGGGDGGGKKRRRQLRRSETERCWKSELEEAETPCAADEQSSEEFRISVIGRQRLQGEESIIQEKNILNAAEKLVFIVTEKQYKSDLEGSIPVLIKSFNWMETAEEIEDLFLGDVEVWRRPSIGHAGPTGGDFPLITREGHNVLDVIFTSPIQNLVEVANTLDNIDGVVDHGVISKIPCTAVIASEDGLSIVENPPKNAESGI